jgi:hypothetical protein
MSDKGDKREQSFFVRHQGNLCGLFVGKMTFRSRRIVTM